MSGGVGGVGSGAGYVRPKTDGTGNLPDSKAAAEAPASAGSYTGLIGADGKPRSGWGLDEAPPVKPTTPGTLIEAREFGNVSVPPPSASEPGKIEYSEPPPPPPSPRTIEVAGTGMGASKKYTMLESEALAVYTILRDNKGNMSVEAMQKALKDKYGIDADITTVDGKKALVNKQTGNTIAVDSNGNGSLDMSDMKLKEALLAAGIDPDWKANPKVFDLAISTVQKAIETSEKRRKEEQELYEAKLATKIGQDKGVYAAGTVGKAVDGDAGIAPQPGTAAKTTTTTTTTAGTGATTTGSTK